MKHSLILIILFKAFVFYGQVITVGGIVKTLESKEVISFASIIVNKSKNELAKDTVELIGKTLTDKNGYFEFVTFNENLVNITCSYVPHISIEIQNINLQSSLNMMYLGTIYLPESGEYQNNRVSDDIVFTTINDPFFDRFSEGDSVQLNYPDSSNKKLFHIKNNKLTIEYEDYKN